MYLIFRLLMQQTGFRLTIKMTQGLFEALVTFRFEEKLSNKLQSKP